MSSCQGNRLEQPFSQAMADALYGSAGYYTAHVRIGRNGDFYTAAASRLFAAVLANYTVNAWHSFAEPRQLQLLEYGGGQGELATSLLHQLQQRLPDVDIVYRIRDVSPRLQARQAEAVAKVSAESAQRLHEPPMRGVPTLIFGNELLDALPVERVRRTKSGWLQAYVGPFI